MAEPTKTSIIRQVMKQQSVSFSVAKKFVDGALAAIEERLRADASGSIANSALFQRNPKVN